MAERNLRVGVASCLGVALVMSGLALVRTAAQGAATQRVFDKVEAKLDTADGPGDVLVWQSVAATQQKIPRDLAVLYEVLHRSSTLTSTPYLDVLGEPIEVILRKRGLVFGAYFPIEIDRVVCHLNPALCRLPPDGSEPVWTNKANDELALPNLTFTTVRVLQEYEKKRGESVKSLVRIRDGCDSYDSSCWKIVENLNGATMQELDALEGPIVIPALSVRTNLPGILPSDARAKLAINLVATARFKDQSFTTMQDPLFDEQRGVFDLVKHPFAFGAPVPDCSAVHVGVVDSEFAVDQHCEFQANAGDNACGENAGVGRRADHGTHVAGIIAARANGRGVVGMSPTVKLHTGRYLSGLVGNTADLEQIIARLRTEQGVQVFNMSFGYTTTSSVHTDHAEKAIRLLQRNVVFVAAAGNDGQDKSGVCDVKPACLARNLGNVISVVALDRDLTSPNLWKDDTGSSNSGQIFDLAAPGERILSTVVGGRVATLSGTSQAAPMVTSAAALLLAIDDKLRPVQIKRRLIATSDLFPSLAQKVFGGRLNVRRAIEDVDMDVFELYNGTVPVKGLLADDTQTIEFLKEDGSRDAVQALSILRIACNNERICTVIFVDRDKKLQKWVNAEVQNTTRSLRVVVDGAVQSIAANTVKDFVSRIRDGVQ
jgi:hypothetical protein